MKIKTRLGKLGRGRKYIPASITRKIFKKHGKDFRIKYRGAVISDLSVRNDNRIEIPKEYRKSFYGKTATLTILSGTGDLQRKNILRSAPRFKQNKYMKVFSEGLGGQEFQKPYEKLVKKWLKKDKYKRFYLVSAIEYFIEGKMEKPAVYSLGSGYWEKKSWKMALSIHNESVEKYILEIEKYDDAWAIIKWLEMTTASIKPL